MIRLARAADAPAIAAIYAPIVERTAISFELEPPSPAEVERRLAATLPTLPWLACEAPDGAFLGYAYASRHRERAAYRWSVDASVYVGEGQRGRGVGRALYASLFAILRLQGYRAVHAGIALPNPASVALHEAVGFRPVGVYPAVGYKLGAWRDVGWWQLALAAPAPDPSPPRPLAALLGTPAFEAALPGRDGSP